jgi:hypothetical protein
MVSLNDKTYHDLAKLGNLEDSFDSVISRLIQKQKAAAFNPESCQGAQGQTAAVISRSNQEGQNG